MLYKTWAKEGWELGIIRERSPMLSVLWEKQWLGTDSHQSNERGNSDQEGITGGHWEYREGAEHKEPVQALETSFT